MTTANAKSVQQSTRAAPHRRTPPRSYVFAITALAIFFVGVVVWRVPVSSYIVTAQIGCESTSTLAATAPTPSQACTSASSTLLAELSNRQVLRDAVRVASAQSATPVFTNGVALRSSDLDSLAHRLRARTGASQGDAFQIELAFESPHAEWATAFLNRLAQQAVRAAGSSAAPSLASSDQLRQARWRLDEARHYQRRALYELQNFIDAHFEQATGEALLASAAEASTRDESRTAKPTRGQGIAESDRGAAATATVDAERSQLEQEIRQSRLRRARLLRQYTENHPQVRDLSLQLTDLQNKLDALPTPQADSDTTAPPLAERQAESSDSGQTVDVTPPMAADIQSADIEQYVALRTAVDAANADYERAHEEFEDQLHLLTASKPRDRQPNQSRWIIAPAAITGHHGGNLPPVRVLVIGLASVTGGLVMAWLAGSLAAVLRVYSTRELQAITQLPLVGQLSIDPTTHDAPRLATRQRVVRWGTLGCELTVGLLALTFVAMVMAGSPTFQQFADDPFGIFAETIAQACRF